MNMKETSCCVRNVIFRLDGYRSMIWLMLSLFWVYGGVMGIHAGTPGDVAGLHRYLRAAAAFTQNMPREKVFVHLDNSSYYRGDKIWFQCYVVEGAGLSPTTLSRTLYVELLTPGGKVVDRCVLKVENGRAQGSLGLRHIPFYSGFYEIRAYTRYMMNFGDEAVFSRVFPVFDARNSSDASRRSMLRGSVASTRYGSQRPSLPETRKVSVRFFPEGGSLVAGARQRIAFELICPNGRSPVGNGRIIDGSGRVIATFATVHDGRGMFELTPATGEQYKAVVNVDGKEYAFDLPAVRSDGVSLCVDNLSSPDTIAVTLTRSVMPETAQLFGVAVCLRGSLWSYMITELDSPTTLFFDKRSMPSGVAMVTLFGEDGRTLSDRMIFVDNGGDCNVNVEIDKFADIAGDGFQLRLTASDPSGTPLPAPLSISVTDGDDAVSGGYGILPYLLLMSEVKGVVKNPEQYFRKDNPHRYRDLDLLMMVQGWRCYSWEDMAGLNGFGAGYLPEKSIEVSGKVVSFVRGNPKPGVTLSAMLSQSEPDADSTRRVMTDVFMTDSCGRFGFSCGDIYGKYRLVMSASEGGKRKDHRILFDRGFIPAPRGYADSETVIYDYPTDGDGLNGVSGIPAAAERADEDYMIIDRMEDSLSRTGIRLKRLEDVVVKGKRRSREADIYEARSRSVSYYDVESELSDIADANRVVGNDLYEVLHNRNPYFSKVYDGFNEEIRYKGRKVLFVMDYKPTVWDDTLNYQRVYVESIKSVYICEDPTIKLRYADPLIYSNKNIDRFGCAVLIETDPDYPAPPGRGTRRSSVEGYRIPDEYRNIDSPEMVEENDTRRTLYWNPSLTTDSAGTAVIRFYNNSTCKNPRISIAGISDDGMIIWY